MIPHIMNANGTISIMLDGSMRPIDTAHKNYDKIKEAIKEQNWDIIPELVNITKEVEDALDTSNIEKGIVKIEDGEVLYNDIVIHNTLTTRIISMVSEGFDIRHMLKFLENLMLNPSYRAVNELYDFLEAGNIPITENGTFLTYKKISHDWKDIYTGTIDNSIGQVISMPRNRVNEDSNITCSSGLHVCSYEYLPYFASSNDNRVIICEVNPKDVVSIPSDYNNTKMRCCEYKVIGEVEDYSISDILSEKCVIETDSFSNDDIDSNNSQTDIYAKNIGKFVTSALEDGFSIQDFVKLLQEVGADINDINYISPYLESDNFKKVGKSISKLIQLNKIDGVELEAQISDLIIDPRFNDGLDNDNICERCGDSFAISDDESLTICPSCWYFN